MARASPRRCQRRGTGQLAVVAFHAHVVVVFKLQLVFYLEGLRSERMMAPVESAMGDGRRHP
jgi:hypothetical protein